MKALTTAIFEKLAGSILETDIGGRLFKGRAPDGSEYPYIVFMMISDVPDDAFAKKGESVMIQFSLFSSASSSLEVENMYAHLKELYDDCSFTMEDSVLIWMRRDNATLMIEDEDTPEGTRQIWHYSVDYEITTQVS